MKLKKCVRLLLVFSLSIIMMGCGQSEESKATDKLISEIGDVSLDSETLIINAEAAVNALSERDKATLRNAQVLSDARSEYDRLVEEKAFNDAVSQIEEAISSISIINEYSESKISNARLLYDKADANVKNAVSNYEDLEKAEEEYRTLKVNKVVELIGKIGDVTIRSGDSIVNARKAYNSLSGEEKTAVFNYSQLESAENALIELQEAAMQRITIEEDKFRGCTYYYPSSWPRYVNNRCHILPYIYKEDNKKPLLDAIYVYTERDWIFFDKIFILTDNNRYTKTFASYDIDKHVSNGVTEYVTEACSKQDEEMFWDICSSGNVEIQFMADSGMHYEFTMKDTDKDAISDLLAAYDYLSSN